jgi:hypothetical protein
MVPKQVELKEERNGKACEDKIRRSIDKKRFNTIHRWIQYMENTVD